MTTSVSKVTLIRWVLKDFRIQCDDNKEEKVISDSFNIGPFCFALFYHTSNSSYPRNSYGVVLKELAGKESVEVNLKLWFENEEGQMFYQQPFQKYTFNKVDEQRQFRMETDGSSWDLFNNAKLYHNSLYICCEFADLKYRTTVSITGYTQFHQNAWLAYEQEFHDAIIKIDKAEFKILKTLFMIQSEFFKKMFLSKFEEDQTSTIEIKDVSEQTMKHLIKWIYTYQIEDKSMLEDLYEVADKYQVNLLKTNCFELMINSLDNSNVFRRLILAIAYDDKQLKEFSLDYIDRMSGVEMASCLTSPEWIELGQKKSNFVKEVNELISGKLKK